MVFSTGERDAKLTLYRKMGNLCQYQMNSYQKPDKKRLLAALQRKQCDRVPNFEFLLMQRNMEAVLGRERLQRVEERYRRLDTVWPARSASEILDRSPLARYSCYLPPDECRLLLERTGQDAVACTLSWKPKSRAAEHEGVLARGARRRSSGGHGPGPGLTQAVAADAGFLRGRDGPAGWPVDLHHRRRDRAGEAGIDP